MSIDHLDPLATSIRSEEWVGFLRGIDTDLWTTIQEKFLMSILDLMKKKTECLESLHKIRTEIRESFSKDKIKETHIELLDDKISKYEGKINKLNVDFNK